MGAIRVEASSVVKPTDLDYGGSSLGSRTHSKRWRGNLVLELSLHGLDGGGQGGSAPPESESMMKM